MNLRPQKVLLAAEGKDDAPFYVWAGLKPLSNKPTEKRATFVEGLDLLPRDERPPHFRFPTMMRGRTLQCSPSENHLRRSSESPSRLQHEEAPSPVARYHLSNTCYNIRAAPLVGGKDRCTGR
jgi:hypothetical protein